MLSGLNGRSIAVILPAYNEELTIANTIRAFHAVLPQAQIVVVNNNSRDRTLAFATAALSEIGAEGKVITELRQGKGNAMRRAFTDIDADIYVLADADETYPADRVFDLMAPVLSGDADMVVGDRHSDGHYARENKRPLHNFGNALVQSLVNGLFRSSLADIMSGYRVFSRKFVKNYPILVEGFQIETDLTLHALHKRFRIVEVAVEYKDRPVGSNSKLNTVRDGAKVLFTIMQILRYYRPFVFFGGLALLFFIGGLLAAIPVLDDWFTTRFITHVPLAILATGMEMVAVVLLAVGLILDSISHAQRLDFERHLLNFPVKR